MKADETQSKPKSTSKYRRVLDARKQPIRGLWQRNDRFYARLKAEDVVGRSDVRWFPLFKDAAQEQPCKTAAEAVAAFEDLKSARRRGKLSKVGQTPLFTDFVDQYFAHHDGIRKAAEEKANGKVKLKRKSTLMRENGPLKLWKEHLAGVRLHKIRKQHIQAYIEKRQTEGMSGGTINYDIIALRNVLNRAVHAELITELPMRTLKPLEHAPRERELVSAADIDRLCQKAIKISKNGQQFSDYVKLMAYCGARRDETLRLAWNDVDWDGQKLIIGSDGLAKNHKPRCVDFNPALEAHLKEMKSRRAPDTEWMFPSWQRGERDIHAQDFFVTLKRTRTAANLPTFGFHDCRHHFISMCVMSRVDYMTIAAWVGHQDGGVLIGRVYGHLSDEHKATMAAKVNFQPVVLDKTA